MRKLMGLGICLALAACAGQPIKKLSKCEGKTRPANPYGVTLPSIPGSGPQERPASVDVFKRDGVEDGDAVDAPPPPANQQSKANQAEVPRLSAQLRPIYSNC